MSVKPVMRRAQAKGLEGWAKPTEKPTTTMESVPPTHIHPTTGIGTALSSNDTTLDSPSRGTIKRSVNHARWQKEEPRGWSRTRLSPETSPSRIRPPLHETPRSGGAFLSERGRGPPPPRVPRKGLCLPGPSPIGLVTDAVSRGAHR